MTTHWNHKVIGEKCKFLYIYILLQKIAKITDHADMISLITQKFQQVITAVCIAMKLA